MRSEPRLHHHPGPKPARQGREVMFCSVLLVLRPSPSIMSNSLRPQGLQPASLLCPQNSPGNDTGVHSYSLLQGIFLTLKSMGASSPRPEVIQQARMSQTPSLPQADDQLNMPSVECGPGQSLGISEYSSEPTGRLGCSCGRTVPPAS